MTAQYTVPDLKLTPEQLVADVRNTNRGWFGKISKQNRQYIMQVCNLVAKNGDGIRWATLAKRLKEELDLKASFHSIRDTIKKITADLNGE